MSQNLVKLFLARVIGAFYRAGVTTRKPYLSFIDRNAGGTAAAACFPTAPSAHPLRPNFVNKLQTRSFMPTRISQVSCQLLSLPTTLSGK